MADLELQSDACSAVSAFPLVGVDMHVCIISTSTEKKRMKGVVDISLILCDAGDTFRASQQEARHPFPGLVPPCLLKPCHELKKSESEKKSWLSWFSKICSLHTARSCSSIFFADLKSFDFCL